MSFSSNFPTIAPSLNLDFANTKALDPRITFTRASTATFYDGVTVAKAEENLSAYSQQFEDAYWAKTGTSVTANSTTAPDGTTTADTLTADGTSSIKRINSSVTSPTSSVGKTFSVFAKANTNNFIQLYFIGDSAPWANFDLSGGTVGSTGTTVTASIVSFGSGWYRCIVSTTSTTANIPVVSIVSSSTVSRGETNTLSTSVFLWGAQEELRTTVTAYTATTTQPITNYIPVLRTAAAGVARFDHNPTTGESRGLLIEEQRANLLTYSEQFDNAAWTKDNSTITANATVSPDGTLTADLWVPTTNGTTANTRIIRSVSVSSSTAYTVTVYVKSYGRRWVYMTAPDASASSYNSWFDLQNGVVGTKGANVTSTAITAVGNGWYRISATSTSTTVTNYVFISSSDADNSTTVTANGFSGIYIWGAQLEAGAFATSYIPTVAASVTRAADNATMTGTNFSSWYRGDEGTAYVEAIPFTQPLPQLLVDFNDGGSNNRWRIFRADITGACSFSVNASGSAQVSAITSGTFTQNATSKAAATYKTNDFALSGNASTVATDTSGIVPVVNVLRIAAQFDGAGVLNGTIKKLAYYPLRLTNAQLQALTS